MYEEKILKFSNRIHKITILIGVLSVVVPLLLWKRIPQQIPIHYNGNGIVDAWSDKSSLILIFLVVLILMGIMSIAIYAVKSSMKSQYSSNYEKSDMRLIYPVIVFMNLVVQCIFAYIIFCVVSCRTLGKLFMPIVLILVFAPLVVFFVKREKRPILETYKEREKIEQGMVYRSKVDLWLGVLLGGCVVWMIYLMLEPIIKKGTINWFVTASALVTIGVILPLFAIKYVLYEEYILISCGIYGKVRVRYEDIVGIKATRNPLSSAALSINRLQLDYVEDGIHRMVLISPVRREQFLKEMENRRNK